MFTGIIQDCGKVLSIEKKDGQKTFVFESCLEDKDLKLGNSIAVNGVCLTVESRTDKGFTATAVPETLQRTTLDSIKHNENVNLEAAIRLETPLAGHLVLGHVDAKAQVLHEAPEFVIQIPESFIKYTPKKGSITVNGVSLTIVQQEGRNIHIALIPETLRQTNLGELQKGDSVNIEIDSLARYLEQLNKYA